MSKALVLRLLQEPVIPHRPVDHIVGAVATSATFISQLCIFGTGYALSTFINAIEADAGLGYPSHTIIALASGINFGLGPILGTGSGIIADKLGPRPLLFFAGVMQIVSLWLTSIAESQLVFILCFGPLMGIAFGLMVAPCAFVTSSFFDAYRNIAMGITYAGGGAGNAIGPIVASHLIAYYNNSYREPMRWLSLFGGLCCLVSIFEARRRPDHPPQAAPPNPPTVENTPTTTVAPVTQTNGNHENHDVCRSGKCGKGTSELATVNAFSTAQEKGEEGKGKNHLCPVRENNINGSSREHGSEREIRETPAALSQQTVVIHTCGAGVMHTPSAPPAATASTAVEEAPLYDGFEEPQAPAAVPAGSILPAAITTDHLPLWKILASRRFLTLFLTTLFFSYGFSSSVFYWIPYARSQMTMNGEHAIPLTKATLITAVFGVSQVAGNLILGFVAARFNPLVVYPCVVILAAAGQLAWCWTRTLGPMIAIAAVVGVGCGAARGILPALVPNHFPGRRVGTMMGFVFLGYGVGGFVGPMITNVIISVVSNRPGYTTQDGYIAGLTGIGASTIVSTLMFMFAVPKPLIKPRTTKDVQKMAEHSRISRDTDEYAPIEAADPLAAEEEAGFPKSGHLVVQKEGEKNINGTDSSQEGDDTHQSLLEQNLLSHNDAQDHRDTNEDGAAAAASRPQAVSLSARTLLMPRRSRLSRLSAGGEDTHDAVGSLPAAAALADGVPEDLAEHVYVRRFSSAF